MGINLDMVQQAGMFTFLFSKENSFVLSDQSLAPEVYVYVPTALLYLMYFLHACNSSYEHPFIKNSVGTYQFFSNL